MDVWHTIYNHPMKDAESIVEWVKGTGLRPYLAAAGEEHREAFLNDYTGRIAAAYPPWQTAGCCCVFRACSWWR